MPDDSKRQSEAPDSSSPPASAEVPAELDWDAPLPPLPLAGDESSDVWSPPSSTLQPMPESVGPRWQQAEIAWPLALLTGFVGSSTGIMSGLPGVGPLAAMLLFAPLYLGLIHRSRTGLAALVSCGWLAGVGAAAAGAVLDDGFSSVAKSCPGAQNFRATEIMPWIESASTEFPSGPPQSALLVVLGLLLVARPTVGLMSLAGLALCASAIGAGVGWFATQVLSMEPALACILGVPPQHAFSLAGMALLVAALADRGRLRPFAEISDQRRNLMLAGVVLIALGILAEPLLSEAWGTWMSEAVG